ncbi:MAG: recombinase family protein [Euryarchaeota archaeon]|nr:recombinase family protein [Euryarchaeota archaeon]
MNNNNQSLNNSNDLKDAEKAPKIAAIYARVSSGKQLRGYSLPEQIKLCRERCEQNGWKVKFIFREEQNAATIDRPRFSIMMQRAKEREFDVVIFWKLDRFCRSLIDVVNVEKQLRDWGISICSLTESLDTTTSAGRFVFRTLASAAQWEREMISERACMGMHALAMQHKWPSRIVPYGYNKNTDGYLTVNEYEAKIVKMIFQRYIKIQSMPQLAFELNEKGIKPRRADRWSATVIKYILDNQIYLGCYQVAGVTDQINELKIISKSLFQKAKNVRYRNKREPIPTSRKEFIIDKFINNYKLFLDDMEELENAEPGVLYAD